MARSGGSSISTSCVTAGLQGARRSSLRRSPRPTGASRSCSCGARPSADEARPYPWPMAESRGATVEFRSVTKRYGETLAVDGLSFTVPAGRICVLVGPTGCGKTTSRQRVNRLIEPTSGEILIDGENVLQGDPTELRRRIGYVIQQPGLSPHQTGADKIPTVPRLLGGPRERIRERVNELLALIGLDPRMLRRYP